jgi:hypothetical protein
MRKLDVKEIHGFVASLGLKLLKPEALERRQERAGKTAAPRKAPVASHKVPVASHARR